MTKKRLALVALPVIALVALGLPFAIVGILCTYPIRVALAVAHWLTGGHPLITKAPVITPESHQLGGASWG